MKYDKRPVAIAVECTKDAALYFDHVIPLLPSELPEEEDIPVSAIVPPNLLVDGQPVRELNRLHMLCTLLRVVSNTANMVKIVGGSTAVLERAGTCIDGGQDRWVNESAAFLRKYHLMSLPLVLPQWARKRLDQKGGQPASNQQSIDLTLSNIELVDVSCLQWDSILEFRKDKESVRRLRNLRLLVSEGYTDKDPAFIQDDLLRRLDEYHDAIKKWRFDTVSKTLSMLLSSKAIHAGVGGAVAAMLGYTSLSLAALTHTVVKLGEATVRVQRARREIQMFRHQHPLAYLIEVEKLAARS